VGFANTTDLIGPYSVAIWRRSDIPFRPNGVGDSSHAYGVNADGSVVVGANGAGSSFRWTAESGTEQLGVMNGGYWSLARGVSGDGSVVVGYGNTKDQYNNEFSRAFRWTPAGGMQSIGALGPYSNSNASATNMDGSVVVGESSNQAFRWTVATGMVALGTLSGSSTATAVNADGSVVIGRSGTSAFRWTSVTGMTALRGDFQEGSYLANGLTSDGSIVVGQHGNTYTALIWNNSTTSITLWSYLSDRGVSLTGWTSLSSATGISSDGRFITGYGVYQGQNRAFIADIGVIPTPSALSFIALGGLLNRRRRN
jgi:probable HAF family extracellular repeat protein